MSCLSYWLCFTYGSVITVQLYTLAITVNLNMPIHTQQRDGLYFCEIKQRPLAYFNHFNSFLSEQYIFKICSVFFSSPCLFISPSYSLSLHLDNRHPHTYPSLLLSILLLPISSASFLSPSSCSQFVSLPSIYSNLNVVALNSASLSLLKLFFVWLTHYWLFLWPNVTVIITVMPLCERLFILCH